MVSVGNLRRLNNLLSVVIVVLALYIIAWPFLPSLTWWVRHDAPLVSAKPHVNMPTEPPAQNTLLIPSLGMEETIYDGPNAATLNKGVWHMPVGSSPDKGGNTVLSGHRFTYSGKAVFYYLDKVKQGDPVYVYWNGKQHDYKVAHIREVSPNDTSIEAPTDTAMLTIYTCTPLWSAKNRLVIQTEPVESGL